MSFLPANYQPPSTESNAGGYMKLMAGENKVRILTPPLIGYAYWTNEDKQRRFTRRPEFVPHDMRRENKWGLPEKIKHFWVLGVWNLNEQAVQILEITQVTIMKALTDLANDDDWGDPRNYTLKIVKSGERQETKFTLVPSPAREIPADVQAKINAKPLYLEALLYGVNPFSDEWEADARNKMAEQVSVLSAACNRVGYEFSADINAYTFANPQIPLPHYEETVLTLLKCLAEAPTATPAPAPVASVPANAPTPPPIPSTLGETPSNLDEIPF